MGKRVSNKRGKHAGARSGRVRLGFYRQRQITHVEREMERHRRKTVLGVSMGREEKETFAALNAALMKLMPKRMERRGVR